MSNIPLARKNIELLIKTWKESITLHSKKDLQLLEQTLLLMYRRPPAEKVARVQSEPMTPEKAELARQMKRNNPDMPINTIAEELKVNPGRVSEALQGDR